MFGGVEERLEAQEERSTRGGDSVSGPGFY